MKKLFVFLIFMFAVSGCATMPDYYVSLDKQADISFEEILRQLKDEKVIFVGEGHSSESDHLVQLNVIKYLNENGKRPAIALEMFPAEMQPVLDSWIQGSVSDSDFEKTYNTVWRMPYWYYEDIFEYARQWRIPLIGINAEMGQINKVAKSGLETVPEGILNEIKFTKCLEDTEYGKIMGFAQENVSHNKKELSHLCDAQRMRDFMMAFNIARFLKKGDHSIVVIVGAAHASKIAVPKMLLRHIDTRYKVLMPKNFRVVTQMEPDLTVADYIWY